MALKAGSEDKKKVAIAAGLGLVVLVLAVRMILSTFMGSSPTPAVAPPPPVQTASEPAAAVHTVRSGTHEAAKLSSPLARLDPTLHPEWMAAAESLEYAGKGRNIFSMNSMPAAAIEAVHAPIRPSQLAQGPSGPPPPPPIDLKFFGYESAKSGARKAFLLHNDDVFIASEGDVVDHRYKVLSILPTSLRVEDIPYNNTQSLPLTQN